jgi:hypothetical protein
MELMSATRHRIECTRMKEHTKTIQHWADSSWTPERLRSSRFLACPYTTDSTLTSEHQIHLCFASTRCYECRLPDCGFLLRTAQNVCLMSWSGLARRIHQNCHLTEGWKPVTILGPKATRIYALTWWNLQAPDIQRGGLPVSPPAKMRTFR